MSPNADASELRRACAEKDRYLEAQMKRAEQLEHLQYEKDRRIVELERELQLARRGGGGGGELEGGYPGQPAIGPPAVAQGIGRKAAAGQTSVVLMGEAASLASRMLQQVQQFKAEVSQW